MATNNTADLVEAMRASNLNNKVTDPNSAKWLSAEEDFDMRPEAVPEAN